VRGQYALKQGTNKEQITKRASFWRDRQKLFAAAIRLELGYEF
jgi:hypothetical protein